jgi:hypothetical protein
MSAKYPFAAWRIIDSRGCHPDAFNPLVEIKRVTVDGLCGEKAFISWRPSYGLPLQRATCPVETLASTPAKAAAKISAILTALESYRRYQPVATRPSAPLGMTGSGAVDPSPPPA